MKTIREALTFDDVSIIPRYSSILPAEASTCTQLGYGDRAVQLETPILSAAMDTVTEHIMARTLALLGGLGIIHKNMPVELQAWEVQTAKRCLHDRKTFPLASMGRNGLLVGAAVSPASDLEERSLALSKARVDVLVVDSAHGHSAGVLSAVKFLRGKFPEILIIAGNVCTADGVRALALAGADVVKVGIGCGAICTTRVVAGVGVPQLTAILECSHAAEQENVSIVADGGVRTSGDLAKAMVAGADAVMLGGMLAGTEESPGEVVESVDGFFKSYRGMGSVAAMELGSASRYGQSGATGQKLVPEGIEGRVPFKGPVEPIIYQLVGGLRASMGYTGSPNLTQFQGAQFVRQTGAGLRESHPHDVQITKKAPNY